MNKRSIAFYGAFAAAVLFLAFAFYMKGKPEPESETVAVPVEVEKAAPLAEESKQEAQAPDESAGRAETKPAAPREAEIEITDADRTTFLESPVAEKWIADFGYTRSDIVRAQRKLREQNVADINDPSTILRALPPRHVATLSITGLDVPSEAVAGKAIPFTLRGTPPSPSFVFTRFDLLVQSPIIRIRAFGHSEGETASGPGEVMELKGNIDPLPAGEYRIEIPELGPAGSFPLVVRP